LFPIGTDRLLLRPFTPADLDGFLAIYSRPDVSRFLYTEPFDAATGKVVLEKRIGLPAFEGDGQALNLAMVVRDTNDLVGNLTLIYRSHIHRQGEIGFVVRPDVQRKGLAREGATQLLRLGLFAPRAPPDHRSM
jgi:RimJ/RimL family protein N-acetyltransferase